jgi:RNA polymerase sigma factor (sigma-70 family)
MSDIHAPPPPDEALDRLYRAHSSSIYRYALALVGNHVDAEDLTQTTFLNAYRALTHGQIPLVPQAWLRQITSNAFRQHVRHDSRRPREVQLHDDSLSSSFIDPVLLLSELRAGFEALTPAQRTALVMRELEGRPTEEIAAGAVAAGVPYLGGQMIHRTRPSIQSGTPTVTAAEPSAQPTRTRLKRGAATPRRIDHRFGSTTRPKNQPAGRPNDRSTNPIAVAVPVSTDQTGYDGVTPPGNGEGSGGNSQNSGTSSNPGHGGTPPGQAKKTSTGTGQTSGTSSNPGHGGTPPGQAKKTSTGTGQTSGTSSNPGHGGTPPGQAKKTSTGNGQNGGNPGDSASPPGQIADANQATGQGGGSSQSSNPGHGDTPPGQDKNTNQGADQGSAVDQGASGPPIVAQPGPNPATGNGHGKR